MKFLIFVISVLLASCYNSNINKNNSIEQISGAYEFDNYQTNEATGTGVGVFYKIKISKESCHVYMEGYQIYKDFACYIKEINDILEVYDRKDNKIFGLIRKNNEKQLTMDLIYYLESNESFIMKKIK